MISAEILMKNSSFLRSGRPSKAASNAFSEIRKIEPEREAFIKNQGSERKEASRFFTNNLKSIVFRRGSALGEDFSRFFVIFWTFREAFWEYFWSFWRFLPEKKLIGFLREFWAIGG